MNIFRLLLLATLIACSVNAQDDRYFISQQGYVSILPMYQSWKVSDGIGFSETSGSLMLYTPLSRVASIALRSAGGSSQGDIATLGGFSDAQVVFNYHLERRNLVFSLGLSLPTGKKELTQEEFETSTVISMNAFHLQVPNFGMGFNAQPGVIWAVPVSEEVVIGLGASFQYKGKFKPLEEFGDYDPGDEILVTGGIDGRVAEGTTVSADLVFTSYGKDKLDGVDVYAAGSKIAVNLQFRKQFDFNELSMLARYRSKARNEFDVGGVLVAEDEKIDADQFELVATYSLKMSERFSLGVLAETRVYSETPAEFTGLTLIGAGVVPTLTLSDNISILGRFKFLTGKAKGDRALTGIDAGLGLRVNF